MTDPGIKLPLAIGRPETSIDIYTDNATLRIEVSSFVTDASELRRLAEILVAALTADANLGDPPCDCIEKKGQRWNEDCECGNPDDRAGAAAWCAEANILCRKSDAEKETK